MNIVRLGFIVWFLAFAVFLVIKLLILSQIPDDYKGVKLPEREDDAELDRVKSLFKGVDLCNVFVWIFGLITVLSISQYYFVQTAAVVSDSMKPTLTKGDCFIVNRFAYSFDKPKHNDIISFKVPPKAMVIEGYTGKIYKPPIDGLSRFLDDMIGKDNRPNYVKRIVGMPGDKLYLSENGLYINGVLAENHFREKSIMPFPTYHDYLNGNELVVNNRGFYYIQVPENKYFVIGDNVNESLDSRDWGCVDRRDIKGKVNFIYYPFNRNGKIK